MSGILLVALAVYLWFPASNRTANTGSSVHTWLRRLRRGARTDEHAKLLAEHARIVRELASLLRSGQNLDTALRNLVLIEKDASVAVKAISTLRLNQQAPWAADQATVPLDSRHHQWLLSRLQWCVQICAESGAPLAEVLDHLAQDLEATLDARRTFDVAMAGPRATTRLLTWLPLVGLCAAGLLGIDVVATFTGSLLGQASLATGLILWAANRWWCRWLLQQCTQQVVG